MVWESATCIRTAGSSARSLAPRLIAAALVGLLACCPAYAQQSGSATQTPDAPSTSAKTATPDDHKSDAMAVPFVNLLSGKSLMFPNLARNNKPLTVKQKFFLAANNSVSGISFIGTAMGAGISQARDTKTGYGQGAEGYFKRWGAGMAFVASSNMIGTFAIASALHEDPRYFVQNSGKFRQSMRYAASRVFICRDDHGKNVTNWAGILGPLGAAGLANTYLPKDSQGVGNTFGNWGIALALSAGANMMREYWPHVNKKLGLPNMGVDQSPGVVDPSKPTSPPANSGPKQP